MPRKHARTYKGIISRGGGGAPYPLRTSIYPLLRVTIIDPTPDLQAPRPRRQRSTGRLVVAGPQHDDMPAAQPVLPVELAVVGGRVLRREVGPQPRRVVVGRERAADDLFDGARVEVYTGSEEGHDGMDGGDLGGNG
jgi:hypothetical protein